MGTPVVVDVSEVDRTLCCMPVCPLECIDETDDGTVVPDFSGGLNGETLGLKDGINLTVGKGSYED